MSELLSKSTVSMFIVGMATISLVACGKSATDKNYSNLMANNPISYQDTLKQNAAGSQESTPGVYVIVTADQSKAVTVHEGQTVTITGTARVQIPNLDFKVVAKNAPSDAQFSVTDDSGVKRWTLTWKTPTGKIPSGQEFLEVQPTVSVVFGTLSADNQKLLATDLASNSLTLGLDIKVQAVSDKPLVESVVGLDGNPVEGVAVPFEIDVNDPGSLAGTPPAIKISLDKSKSSADGAVDVSTFITADSSKQAQSTGDGNWKLFFVFNTGDKLITRPAKHSSVGVDEVRATFLVSVASSSKLTSSSSQAFNLKLNTAKQAPVLTPVTPAQLDHVTMGQPNKIDIMVTSPDASGKLRENITDTNAALKLLPGTAKASCLAATDKGMPCRITWTPACTATDGATESVQLKVTNTVGGISAQGVWSQDIKMVKPDNCGVTPPKAPAKSKAAAPVKGAKPAKPVTPPVKGAAAAPVKVAAAAPAPAKAGKAAPKTPTPTDKKAPAPAPAASAPPKGPAVGAVPAPVAGVDAKDQKTSDASSGGK